MQAQVLAILWAQFRISRNHFPRSSFGTVLSWSVSGLWYMLFVAFAVIIARALPETPAEYLVMSLSAGLLAIFTYMLVVPLLTASAGWSLELDKLQAFPISDGTLFLLEVMLRLTSSPEMLILLCGGFIGLLLRGDVFPLGPVFLVLFLSFSLLLQLAIRDFILHSFARNRFREILTLLLVSLSLLPQLLLRSRMMPMVKPYLLLIANGRATPWHEIATQSAGHFSVDTILAIVCWNVIALVVARAQFMKSLRREDSFRPAALMNKKSGQWDLISALVRPFPDPFGALFEKEMRTLIRMPRFRVLFGMACVFSLVVFMPVAMQAGENSFMGQNAVPVTSLYGLLLLSDALLLNIFGFDRGAAQVYFATPPKISAVIHAKNLAAVIFIALQSLAIPLLSVLFRIRVTLMSVAAGFLSAAVVTIFLLATGNMLSVVVPRPIDPKSAFRKQGATKVQLWLLMTTFGMFLLVGSAFLARWATDQDWVLLATLGFEFLVGLVVYQIAMESTVERLNSRREQMMAELSKNTSPMGS